MFNFILRIERWKFNKDYGVYVSTEGRFKDRRKRILPIKINKSGYCLIKTEQGYKLAHRIVLFTWNPIPDSENLTVDHLNHNKRDNRVRNLEWITKDENLKRAEKDFIKGNQSEENEKIINNKKIFLINDVVSLSFEETIHFLKISYSNLNENRTYNKLKNIYQSHKETFFGIFKITPI